MPDEEPLDVSFPKLQATKPAVLTRPYEQRTWSGDKDRMIAIQDLLEAVLQEAYQKELAKLDLDRPDYRTRQTLQDLRSSFELKVEVRGRDGKWVQEGELTTVFGAVELDEVEEVRFSNSPHWATAPRTKVEVRFRDRRMAFLGAVDVQVSSTDPTWVTGVTDQLATLIARGRPKWDLLRGPVARFGIGWVLAIGLMFTYNVVVKPDTASETVLYILLIFAVTVGASWAVGKLIDWGLPAFEIVPAGGGSMGSRRLGVMLALIAFAVGNVFLPIVLAIVMD